VPRPKRGAGRPPRPSQNDVINNQNDVTPTQFVIAKKHNGTSPHNETSPRLCGDLTDFIKHAKTKKSLKNPKNCVVCGNLSYSECTTCGKAVHAPSSKNGELCFYDLHDDCFFGLSRDDCSLVRKRKADWTYPTPVKRRANTKHIESIVKYHAENDN
jgi:hypothetical protein